MLCPFASHRPPVPYMLSITFISWLVLFRGSLLVTLVQFGSMEPPSPTRRMVRSLSLPLSLEIIQSVVRRLVPRFLNNPSPTPLL